MIKKLIYTSRISMNSSKINPKTLTLRHILIKLAKNNRSILEIRKIRASYHIQIILNEVTADFTSETIKAT